mgnify:CR=1 FL=1
MQEVYERGIMYKTAWVLGLLIFLGCSSAKESAMRQLREQSAKKEQVPSFPYPLPDLQAALEEQPIDSYPWEEEEKKRFGPEPNSLQIPIGK